MIKLPAQLAPGRCRSGVRALSESASANGAATGAQDTSFFGHPKGLAILFFAEMWERFSFYGMRGLLIIYLTQHFLFSDEKSALIYGAYGALVYVMTIIGGTLADKYLGQRKAVIYGAILLVLGHFGMAFEGSGSKEIATINGAEYQLTLDGRGGDGKPIIVQGDKVSAFSFDSATNELVIADPALMGLPERIDRASYDTKIVTEELFKNILFLSLALIIAGVGFLKANISTIVGALYPIGDPRRDSGFTLFYMGINLGSFLSSITCGILGIVYGWAWGFGLAGVGMLLGLIVFLWGQKFLDGKADPPDEAVLKKSFLGPINIEMACYLSGVVMIALSMFLVMNEELVGGILVPIGILMFAVLVGYAFLRLKGRERNRMFAAIYFVLAQIPFWALFEQAGSSLNLFTDRLVDRNLFGWSVPAPVFQSLNAGFIFLFAPLIAWLWIWLAKRNWEPSTPVKFALGVLGAGLGFLALVAGIKTVGPAAMTPVLFIFLIYWIHTMSELLVSPVGLSAVTKLAPPQVVGMTMGAWFLYSGLSNFLAGIIAKRTGSETISGQLTDVAAAKATYVDVYSSVGLLGIGIAIVMLLVSPFIKQWMKTDDGKLV